MLCLATKGHRVPGTANQTLEYETSAQGAPYTPGTMKARKRLPRPSGLPRADLASLLVGPLVSAGFR
jgi:hypothetical protein